MKIAFVVILCSCAAAFAGGCGGVDNTFIFDADGSASLLSSESSGGGRSGDGSSGAPTCSSVCSATAQCQTACGTPPSGYLFCCDTTISPGRCYPSTAGSCALVGADAAAIADTGAVSGMSCTATAACGSGRVCCLGRRNGTTSATCQSNCNGVQLCASDADCPQNLACMRAGGGLRVCQ